MNDWGQSVLERYPLEIRLVRRVRGALLCETNRGLKLLQEYSGSIKHLEAEYEILEFLKERGGFLVDICNRSTDGILYTENEEKTRYVLKDWYPYQECNVASRNDLCQTVRTLAKMHMLLRHVEFKGCENYEVYTSPSLLDEYEKHTKELRRVRSYIRNKRKKTAFELCIMDSFGQMFEQAETATNRLLSSEYQDLYMSAVRQGHVCHGAYHQHNVLIGNGQTAVVNFNHFFVGLQIADLYQFMRKVLEKHNWSTELGELMMEEYHRINPISTMELKILYAMFEYPEKYWKQMNFYYNSRKAWIPQRNIDKLKNAADQYHARTTFLDKVL